MKSLFYIFLFITVPCFSQANYKLVKTIEIENDFFTTDNQSNVYVVKADELFKYDKSGRLLYKYSNKNLGNISFVDVSNMLRIVVFYKDFLHVVFLDNTLSINGEPVALDNMGYQQAQLVCSSYGSGIWMYNQQNFELLRLDETLLTNKQTGNLNVLLSINLQPNFLIENDNKVYLNNPSTGILVFDIYGTYYKTIAAKGLRYFQPLGDVVYFESEKKIKSYNIKTTEEKEFIMPSTDFDNFRLETNIFFLRTNKAIRLYSVE